MKKKYTSTPDTTIYSNSFPGHTHQHTHTSYEDNYSFMHLSFVLCVQNSCHCNQFPEMETLKLHLDFCGIRIQRLLSSDELGIAAVRNPTLSLTDKPRERDSARECAFQTQCCVTSESLCCHRQDAIFKPVYPADLV